MKVVYNICYGGFHPSAKALGRYAELKGLTNAPDYYEIPRHDPALVQAVEELGDEANTSVSHLAIAEIPDGSLYRIDEYDGNESVETQDTIDWINPNEPSP